MKLSYLITFLLLFSAVIVVSVHADNDNRNVNKGVDLAGQGQYQEALDAFNRQIQLVPGESDRWNMVWGYKATVLYKLGKIEEAREAINHELKLNQFKDNTLQSVVKQIANIAKGYLIFSDDDAQDFIEQMENTQDMAGISTSTQDITPKSNTHAGANKYSSVGNQEIESGVTYGSYVPDSGVSTDTTTHTENSGETANYWNNRGVTLQTQGDYAGAINAFDHAIQLEPTNSIAFLNKGAVYALYLKDYDESMRAYDQAIEIGGMGAAGAKGNKIELLIQEGKLDEALKLSKEYKDLGRESTILNKLGRTEEAKELSKQANRSNNSGTNNSKNQELRPDPNQRKEIDNNQRTDNNPNNKSSKNKNNGKSVDSSDSVDISGYSGSAGELAYQARNLWDDGETAKAKALIQKALSMSREGIIVQDCNIIYSGIDPSNFDQIDMDKPCSECSG